MTTPKPPAGQSVQFTPAIKCAEELAEYNLSHGGNDEVAAIIQKHMDARERLLRQALDDICREVNNGCKDRQARLLHIRAIYLKLRDENKLQ